MADSHGCVEGNHDEYTGPVFAGSDSDEFGDALLDALGSESSDDDGDAQDSPERLRLFNNLLRMRRQPHLGSRSERPKFYSIDSLKSLFQDSVAFRPQFCILQTPVDAPSL